MQSACDSRADSLRGACNKHNFSGESVVHDLE
jgi:hypothetical protein